MCIYTSHTAEQKAGVSVRTKPTISWAVLGQAGSKPEQIPFFCGCPAMGAQAGLGCWKGGRKRCGNFCVSTGHWSHLDRGAADKQPFNGTVVVSFLSPQHLAAQNSPVSYQDLTGNDSPSHTNILDYNPHFTLGLTWDFLFCSLYQEWGHPQQTHQTVELAAVGGGEGKGFSLCPQEPKLNI